MKRSIRLRITLWYAVLFSLLLLLVLGSIYVVLRTYSQQNIENELRDETMDIVEELQRYIARDADADLAALYAREDWTSFYDDSVMVSLYRENGEQINGLLPEKFPQNYAFASDELRTCEYGNQSWLVYDCLFAEAGQKIWIRSISSHTEWSHILWQILVMFALLFLLILAIAVGIGYRMLKQSLQPIYTISSTADEIARSGDLAKRIPTSEVQDEFSYLIETFNHMLERLEQSFENEKRFSSDVSHELRTPLSVIQAHSEYCLEDLALEEEVRREIAIIHKKTEQISRLILQLLSISRAENGSAQPEREDVDFVLLVESVVEELAEKAREKNIRLRLEDRTEGHAALRGDTMLLMRMLMNLIENAIEYGRPGGFVHIALAREGMQLRICVDDNGIGIPEDEQDKIWKRFYRVDKSRSGHEGFGLGLYLVHWIVRMHGGTISMRSEVNVGTEVTVLLPAE